MSQLIMVVDDSNTVRRIMSGILKNNGYDVMESVDGEDAWEKIEGLSSERSVDLVLTDINMPKMNGIDLIKKLKAHPKYQSIPVVTLTSESETKIKEQGKQAGAFAWIVKPSTPEKVSIVVKVTLQRHKEAQ